MNLQKKLLLILAIFVTFMAGSITALYATKAKIARLPEPAFHEHADFALFINGERFDFAKGEYMSTEPCKITRSFIPTAQAHEGDRSQDVHLHNRNGSIVHVHAPSITWHNFFDSLNMSFQDDEFVTDQGLAYKPASEKSFIFLVNGEEVETLAQREIRNLDQVLISISDTPQLPEQIALQWAQVGNDACLYSESCPHRGVAPVEACGTSYQQPSLIRWLGL